MEKDLFTLEAAKKEVKCLGIKVDIRGSNGVENIGRVHIYINGSDISVSTLIENVRITFDKE